MYTALHLVLHTSPLLIYLGWSLGRRWGLALHLIQSCTLPVLGLLALLVVLYWIIKRLLKRKITARLRHLAAGEA